MKKNRFPLSLSFLIGLPFLAPAQTAPSPGQPAAGIHFEDGLSWSQIRAKAFAEHKYLFVDAYASWCGPCKMMDRDVYPDPLVGEVYNKNFITVRLQMDSSSGDNDLVRSHYADAHEIQSQYPVTAYPSFLFFSPDGKLVHKALGFHPADQFIVLAHEALDPATQYYTLLDKYQRGKLAPDQVAALAVGAVAIDDQPIAKKASGEYIDHILAGNPDSLYTQEHIGFIARFTNRHADKGFDLFTHHADGVNALMKDPNFCGDIIDRIVIAEEIDPLPDRQRDSADWQQIRVAIAAKYTPLIADRASTKATIYQSCGRDWPLFVAAIVHYTDNYEDQDKLKTMDRNANFVLDHSDVRAQLERALAWCDRNLEKDPTNPTYQQTREKLRAKLATP